MIGFDNAHDFLLAAGPPAPAPEFHLWGIGHNGLFWRQRPTIKRRLEHRPQLIQPLSLVEIYQATPVVHFGVVTDGVAAEGAELSETEAIDLGAHLYAMNCAPCHRANGEGNLNRFPTLNHNAFVTAQSPQPLIRTVLHGRGVMPAFHPTLNPTEIAAVLSYIRQAWSNDAAPITAAQGARGENGGGINTHPQGKHATSSVRERCLHISSRNTRIQMRFAEQPNPEGGHKALLWEQ